jgi:hypothetical protein
MTATEIQIPAASVRSSVVELRRYTLRSGQRDALVDLFERELYAPQEELGMELMGTFRDVDRDDRFVWLRGFADMEARDAALRSFYGGPVWAEHGPAANATMIDSDDVYLLRPVPVETLSPNGAGGKLVVTIHHLDHPAEDGFLDHFRAHLVPKLASLGATVEQVFVTELAWNTYRALPVWENWNVLVWVGHMPEDAVPETSRLSSRCERVRLEPTARSRMR